MAAKRLTRKEIVQEDAIRKTLTETSGWLLKHLNYILGAAGLIVVIAVGSLVWNHIRESRDAQAQIEFSNALERFHAPVDEDDQAESGEDPNRPDQQTRYRYTTSQERYEESLEAFREVAEEYPSLWLGGMSRYYVGLSLIELGRVEEAKEELQSAVEESSWTDVSNLARNALAQLAVGEGDHQRAIEFYEQIVKEPSPNLPLDLALMRLARNLELAGNKEEALNRYRQVTTEHAGSPTAAEAQNEVRRLESLLGKQASPEDPHEEKEVEGHES